MQQRRWFSGLVSVLILLMPTSGHAATTQQAATLITNQSFEAELAPWLVCGGATRTTERAHGGQYAIRLGNPTTTDCPLPPPELAYLGRVDQALTYAFAVPSTTQDMTVSFWYYVAGAASSEVSVIVSKGLYTSNYNSAETAYLDRLLAGDQPGWHLFRQVLTADQLAVVTEQTNVSLQFRIEDPLAAGDSVAFFIDDVQVTLARVTTAASPLPAALRSDTTQPIVYVRDEPASSYSDTIYRINIDGSGARQIFRGYLTDSADPVWSPNGQQIALIDDNVYPANQTDPNKYVSATALMIINPNGGAARRVYQTSGVPGDPDFVSQITHLSWSPDGTRIAASFFEYLRYDNGRLEGGLASIQLVDAASEQQATPLLKYATNASWNKANQLLFETYDLYGDSQRSSVSISELELTTQPPTERPLIADPKLRYDTDNDSEPVWAPNGSQFLTIRTVSGSWYDNDGDSAYNHAIMLFDRASLETPRMLLLADHGFVSDPAWSPDGRYLVYTLQREGKTDLWWLDVADGTTGPITTDGLSRDAHWRPTSTSRVFIPVVRRR